MKIIQQGKGSGNGKGNGKIKGKGKALITGASTGIGAVYADRLARRGYDLILVARHAVPLEVLASRLARETGRAVQVVGADLTQKNQLREIEAILASDPAVTMLVNNASLSGSAPFFDASADDLEAIIALNIVALTRLSNAAAKRFAARNSGTLINVGSGIVVMPEVANEVYGGSKAYVLNFSRNIAAQLAPHGVRVQVVLPGAILTESWARAGTGPALLPAGVMMSAEDMVDAALAGLDLNETITFPSMEDQSGWHAMEQARRAMGEQVFQSRIATRYRSACARTGRRAVNACAPTSPDRYAKASTPPSRR